MVNTAKIINAIKDDIKRLVQEVMSSDLMINKKSGTNTIIGSDLYKSLETDGNDDFIFHFYLNDYVQYVESGRRAGAKFPPVEPIVKWCRKNGIPTDNSTIFLIRRAISREGIKPRPFIATVFEEMDKIWDKGWSDSIFDTITEELDRYFR